MHDNAQRTPLQYPFPKPPAVGEFVKIATGILWSRMQLPFRLDHVNIYLIADDDGWAILDTGLDNVITRQAWDILLAHPLVKGRLTRLIVTHFHPDHIGLAGWLCERFGIPLVTSHTAYLTCQNLLLNPLALDAKPYREFYARHGMDQEFADQMGLDGHRYSKMVGGPPPNFVRVIAGDILWIGAREFRIIAGDGHAPEQLMLYCTTENILFSADQIIPGISPHIGVSPVDPGGNPLKLFLRSLEDIASKIPSGALVLPGHRLPFYGLQERCQQLNDHHIDRCGLIERACLQSPHSVAELIPVVFPIKLDEQQMTFAFSEVHAHVNFMVHKKLLTTSAEENRITKFVTHT